MKLAEISPQTPALAELPARSLTPDRDLYLKKFGYTSI